MATQSPQQPNPQQLSPKTPTNKKQPSQLLSPLRVEASSLNQKCVCELCTCGKHHCPKPRVKGIFQTSYQNHYKQFKFDSNSYPPARQFQYEMKHYNPDHLKSNYQENYIKLDAPNVNKSYSMEYPPRKSLPFIDETEYKKNYQNVETQPAVAVNSPSRFENVAKKMILSPPIKFNASTSYNDHYKGYTLDKPQQSLELIPQVLHSPIKFQGQSNYQSSYVAPPLTPSKPIPMEYHHSMIPFKGQSTYKSQFVGYKYEPVKQIGIMIPNISLTPAKFQGKTSYQNDYDGKNLPKPEEVASKPCICDRMNIPRVNLLDKPHLRFDIARNQWV